MVAAGLSFHVPSGHAAPAEYPRIAPGAKVRGEAALTRLGNELPAVAAFHGKSVREMRSIFRRDPRLWVAQNGVLDYVCAMEPLAAPGEEAGAEIAFVEESIPIEDTFFLHSRPGATRVIYLDFDGHTTTGMHWNTTYNDGEDIVTPPYSTDGDTASFNTTDYQNIAHMWQRVAEDFAPYEVNVTTEDPGVEGLRWTSGGDVHYGIRVCIGGSSTAWYGSAGGVASLSSFSSSQDTPCFVFPAQLGNGNKKYVADAISHEVGHTLGLHHDGVSGGTSYYTGHGDWSPIMGAGYYTPLGQWSRGEYPSANNPEDDLAIIASFIAYRNDDHGNAIATATPVTATNVFAAGVIETGTDVDVFTFQTGSGNVNLTVRGPSPSPNLDVQAILYDEDSQVIATIDPGTLEASLSMSLPAGTYYVAISGVGAGDLATGYSDYGSLGEYQITGTVTAPNPVQPTPPAPPSGLTAFEPTAPLLLESIQSFDADGQVRRHRMGRRNR